MRDGSDSDQGWTMKQIQQKNVRTWSCPHQTYVQANLTYDVMQERGYSITRLRSTELLESPASAIPEPLPPSKQRSNVIPFPSAPAVKPQEPDEDLLSMMT